MTDLADFLRARYAERRAKAEAASPGPWHLSAEGDEVLAVDGIVAAEAFALSNRQLRATAAHIAANDPADVLADLDAKLALVDDHSGTNGYVYTDDGTRACQTCGDSTIRHPCNVLRLLAQPFAKHAEYEEGWKAWATTN